jgi:hypothetical protein
MGELESRLDWLDLMSPSVAEACMQHDLQSSQPKENSIKKKLQMAKKSTNAKDNDAKKKDNKDRQLSNLSMDDYMYQIK